MFFPVFFFCFFFFGVCWTSKLKLKIGASFEYGRLWTIEFKFHAKRLLSWVTRLFGCTRWDYFCFVYFVEYFSFIHVVHNCTSFLHLNCFDLSVFFIWIFCNLVFNLYFVASCEFCPLLLLTNTYLTTRSKATVWTSVHAIV